MLKKWINKYYGTNQNLLKSMIAGSYNFLPGKIVKIFLDKVVSVNLLFYDALVNL
jgi:hypothetical protein